jgi:hypothetical protein
VFKISVNQKNTSILNKENTSKLWKMIQKAGDYLLGQLPSHPNHPKGRNPYAHVALCVKEKFGNSYKDIPDDKFQEVVDFIRYLKSNAS